MFGIKCRCTCFSVNYLLKSCDAKYFYIVFKAGDWMETIKCILHELSMRVTYFVFNFSVRFLPEGQVFILKREILLQFYRYRLKTIILCSSWKCRYAWHIFYVALSVICWRDDLVTRTYPTVFKILTFRMCSVWRV